MKVNLEPLQSQLKKGEHIRYSGFGTYDIAPHIKNPLVSLFRGFVRNGVFAATDKRIIIYFKKISGSQLRSFSFADITSVAVGRGILTAHLTFTTPTYKVRMRLYNQKDIPLIAILIQKHTKRTGGRDKKVS